MCSDTAKAEAPNTADVVAAHFPGTATKPVPRDFSFLVFLLVDELIPERVNCVRCAWRQHVPVVRAVEERGLRGGKQAGEGQMRALLLAGLEESRAPPSLRMISDDTFCYCWRRKQVVLNEDPEKIGDSCFSDTWLEKVSFARTPRYIGYWAFTPEHTASRTLRTL